NYHKKPESAGSDNKAGRAAQGASLKTGNDNPTIKKITLMLDGSVKNRTASQSQPAGDKKSGGPANFNTANNQIDTSQDTSSSQNQATSTATRGSVNAPQDIFSTQGNTANQGILDSSRIFSSSQNQQGPIIIPEPVVLHDADVALPEAAQNEPSVWRSIGHGITRAKKVALNVVGEAVKHAIPLTIGLLAVKTAYDSFKDPKTGWFDHLGANLKGLYEFGKSACGQIVKLTYAIGSTPEAIIGIVGGLYAIGSVKRIRGIAREPHRSFGRKALDTISETAGLAKKASLVSLAIIVASNSIITLSKIMVNITQYSDAPFKQVFDMSAKYGVVLGTVLLVSIPVKFVVDAINKGLARHQ
ncbi:MAG TPA: hypothetical protein PLO51_01065, partial [Candidatus Micrarchaeota archaeon]|nr:hypothetical protein [Candidatus Micrarchaeota archaeon]